MVPAHACDGEAACFVSLLTEDTVLRAGVASVAASGGL